MPQTDISPLTDSPLILNTVSKSFGAAKAVNGVSFEIGKGQIIGFLGSNGAGKTTTLRMALGLIKPDHGDVSLFGRAPGPSAFGRLGFLPEERGLYRKSTARASIAHMARLNGMRGKDAYARADEMMDRYGLGDAKRMKIKALSKGMAQKVQLIAAIAHDPEFLILDEPFSGLDPVNQALLEEMVREIAQRGRTIIFSTHVMEHAERLCDRIILMAKGAKIFDDSTANALSIAPRRLVLELPELETSGVGTDWLESYASGLETMGAGLFRLTLKDNADSQTVLEDCVARKLRLSRFEPERATLHDAFVAMIEGAAP